MTDQKNFGEFEYPGFRYVLGVALIMGVVGGFTDVSYIFTRSPDLIANIMLGWRFIAAGIFLTFIAMLPYVLIAWLIVRLIASARKWPFVLSLATIYLIAFLPAGLITIRNISLLMAEESILVVQVKSLYYGLKFLWILIPFGWALGLWLATLQKKIEPSRLYGNMSGLVLSAAFYLYVTPYWQQVYLINKANVTSEMTSDVENMVMAAAVFVASVILIPLFCWIFRSIAKIRNGTALIALWLVILIFPYLPAIFATGRLVGTPPSGNDLIGRPRNVVLVSMDTVRYDDMGFNGAEITETPFLDSIAAESIVFDSAITPMPMTGPAHISMFTGLQPDSNVGHGVKSNGKDLDDSFDTLGTLLDDAGYSTGAVLAGFPLARRACGLERGFHYYHDDFGEGLRSRFLPDQIWFLTVAKLLRRLANIEAGLPHGMTKTADDVTDQAIDFLEENHNKPFFLFVHYFDAHYLYAPPPPFDNKYAPGYTGKYKDMALSMSQIMEELKTFTSDDHAYYRAMYRGEISFLDQEFKRLYDWGNSDGRNLWDDTLLIVVSDHGEGFEHDYYFMHTDRVYDQLVHVPLFIRDPDKVAVGTGETRVDELVNVSDIYFTVLNWLGLQSPKSPSEMHDGIYGSVDGWNHDLLGFYDGIDETGETEINDGTDFRDWTESLNDYLEPEKGWNFIASQSYTFIAPGELSLGRFFSFRFPEWKLIYGPESEPVIPTYQYFDLENDPDEMIDLYPEISWAELGLPNISELLSEWSGRQGMDDQSDLSPEMRAELKALGYIDEGPSGGQQDD